MDDPTSIATQLTGLTPQQQIYVTWVVMIFGMIGKLLGALGSAGGLRGILMRAWSGTSVPRPIAEDYKEELKTPTKGDSP